MNWETRIARRLFPKEQTFMARRRLRIALLALAVGIVVSAVLLGLIWLANKQR